MAHIPPTRQDHLLLALAKCEELRNSNNAPKHQSGSLAALTPADLQMELDTMLELQAVLHTLAHKLDINSTASNQV